MDFAKPSTATERFATVGRDSGRPRRWLGVKLFWCHTAQESPL